MNAALKLMTPAAIRPMIKDNSPVQDRIYQETRGGARPIRHLTTWLLDRQTLYAAWERVCQADGANTPGTDAATCDSIRPHIADWLVRLADDLFHRRYRPQSPRWVDVPKPNKPGQTRRLGILTIRDRVVHTALKLVLEPVFEPIFLATSFGFRPGRSVQGALAEACRHLGNTGAAFTYAVPLDVAECFDTVDHNLLLTTLKQHVADEDLLALIRQILDVGGKSVGRFWWKRTCGLVQGSSLSPLLCNLALHAVDLAVAQFGRDTQGGAVCLRYADDLLVLARDSSLARKAVGTVQQTLGKLCQGLRDASITPIPTAARVPWLGVQLAPRRYALRDQASFGYHVPDDKVMSMVARIAEMTTLPSEKIAPDAFNIARWIVSVNDQLRAWWQVYQFADNAADAFRVLDAQAHDRVADLIRSLAGASMSDLYRQYRVRLPRGFWTWEVPGARLAVLSALAPHAPLYLTRRPAWMRNDKPATPSANATVAKIEAIAASLKKEDSNA